MFFKKLEISGFKSFAKKVIFKFEPGITAVVGPNGCGKTNIADAIRWVLGEQSYRALRVNHMHDLIFSGTAQRSHDNIARVALTMENNDGRACFNSSWADCPEVTITRKLFRSGESEYYINRKPVRLKDITELFLDTGVGTSAYSLIEKEKIHLILSNKPEDRRFLIEEAAGIMKYRSRKIEAGRKLEHTENNLVRVRDIIAEVKRSINAQRRQASRARRYKRHHENLKALEVKLSLHNLKALREEWTLARKELEKARMQKDQFHKDLSGQEKNLDTLRQGLSEKEGNLHQVQKERYDLISQKEDQKSMITILKERKENLFLKKEDLFRRIESMKGKEKEFGRLMEKIKLEENSLQEKIVQERNALKEKEEMQEATLMKLEEMQKKERDNLCFCCTECSWRGERDKGGCFVQGKRFSSIGEGQSAEIHPLPSSFQQEIEEIKLKRDGINKALIQTKITLATLEEKLSGCKREMMHGQTSSEELTRERKEREEEVANIPRLLENIDKEIEERNKGLAQCVQEEREVEKKFSIIEKECFHLRGALDREEEKISFLRGRQENYESQLREWELKDLQFKMQAENLKERIKQDYGVSLEEQSAPQEEEPFDPEQIKENIEALKRKLQSIGPVNVMAIEEYERFKERYLFLKGQHDDLTKAAEDLRKLIVEIDKKCRQQFSSTFSRVKECFENMFRQLFEGGEAKLILNNPENVLDSDIEIIAQPPGKKLQSILFLSEGERTLTAIALLFSIFIVKPSPFCVLDEVDAPLDESNIGRFARLLREFSSKSQFIVITHNKRTMEIAHALYGITMQEKGISTLVSVRLGEMPDSVQSPAPVSLPVARE